MFFRKGLFFVFILLATQCYSQTGVSFSLGVGAWHFVDKFDDLSNPVSLEYTGGINVEKVLGKSSVGVMTGLHYAYSPPGTKYTDLTDQQNELAVIFEQEINERYINVVHHELCLPLMLIFYHNGLRTGVGASVRQYMFDNKMNGNSFERFTDYGLNACTGARLSKRVIFTIGYYYGLKKVINLSATPVAGVETASIKSNMQQLQVHLSISLFNNFDNQKYFVTSE